MWDKTQHYLRKIGTIILVGVVIVWAMEYFPRTTENSASLNQEKEIIQNNTTISEKVRTEKLFEIESKIESDRLINSYLGQLGQIIEPVMRPLGFDWKMSISLIAGLPAKEIVISTMGVLYQSGNDESTVNLQNKLKNEKFDSGKRSGKMVFTTPTALAFLIFILIYFPCIGVIATIKNESESWKWATFVIFYTTGLAWVAAFLVQTISSLII
jgi:ferrous iron transport protein B